MAFTNLIISPNKRVTSSQVNKSFSKEGLSLNEEVKKGEYNITDEYNRIEKKKEEVEKAHVKSHTAKTKSGKLVQVKDYENKKTRKSMFDNILNRFKGKTIKLERNDAVYKISNAGNIFRQTGEGFTKMNFESEEFRRNFIKDLKNSKIISPVLKKSQDDELQVQNFIDISK